MKSRMAMAAILALAAYSSVVATEAIYGVQRRRDDDDPLREGYGVDTVNTGRRAEKAAAALAKAQAKRDRRAAKRMKTASSNAKVSRGAEAPEESAAGSTSARPTS